MQNNQRYNRYYSVIDGYSRVVHGYAGDLGYNYGYNKLKGLHFTQFALAHQPDDKKHENKNYNAFKKDYQHIW